MSKLTTLLSVGFLLLSTACGVNATAENPRFANGGGGGGGPTAFAAPSPPDSSKSAAEPKVSNVHVHDMHHGYDSGFHARCHRCF